jgi:predicted RNA-binding protein associated with RNAse of E/G family
MAELCLLDVDNLAAMALRAAVLPRHPADKAFRSQVTILQNRDRPAAAPGLRSFPRRDS